MVRNEVAFLSSRLLKNSTGEAIAGRLRPLRASDGTVVPAPSCHELRQPDQVVGGCGKGEGEADAGEASEPGLAVAC